MTTPCIYQKALGFFSSRSLVSYPVALINLGYQISLLLSLFSRPNGEYLLQGDQFQIIWMAVRTKSNKGIVYSLNCLKS